MGKPEIEKHREVAEAESRRETDGTRDGSELHITCDRFLQSKSDQTAQPAAAAVDPFDRGHARR